MKDKEIAYPYEQKGARKAPERREVDVLVRKPVHEGGLKDMPAPAQKFASRFSTTLTHYPKQRELPNWLRALVEKKVPVEELAKTTQERLLRAPSEENMEITLLVANEIARMKGGPEALGKYITPDLLAKLHGKGGQQ
ncbi:MAG TPA: hypothetical protein VEV42_08900 [Pyrinomonadaceae bacterium]|nr:hypothetical protein [Pyrinomonadaceae bacterium]